MTVAEYLRQEGLKEGHFQGKQEGFFEGEKKTMQTIARKLFENGITIEIINKTTGLTEEELKKIIQ